MYTHTHVTCMHACMHACMYVRTRTYVRTYVCMCVYIHIYTNRYVFDVATMYLFKAKPQLYAQLCLSYLVARLRPMLRLGPS